MGEIAALRIMDPLARRLAMLKDVPRDERTDPRRPSPAGCRRWIGGGEHRGIGTALLTIKWESKMFGSTILDVAMGLIFSFLMISLVTSAVTEGIASALSWRANTLLQGVKDLLNDPQFSGLALKIYNHAAVNPRSNGTALSGAELTAKPSYIDAKQFAAAFMDVAELVQDTSLTALQVKVNATVPDPQLNKLLNGMIARTGGNINRIGEEIAAWFDTGMDRVAGVYKRKVQLWAFFIGLGLAIILNVDTVKIAPRRCGRNLGS